ncbi:MAG: cupin domain-containing protein [Saprospiraceae bacterium]
MSTDNTALQVTFDLCPALRLANLMHMKTADFNQKKTYLENRPNVEVLLESEFTKEIRILMKAGQLMKEHKTPFPIVVQLLEGKLDFGVQGKVTTITAGAILSLEGGIPHDLKALADSSVRLTLVKGDAAQRVEGVAKSE